VKYPTRPIVVVDRRTYRAAGRKLAVLTEAGDWTRVKFALTAMWLWLRREIRTGPGRRRPWCAAQLERVELAEDRANQRLGLAAVR
jgi:hypothetical protein